MTKCAERTGTRRFQYAGRNGINYMRLHNNFASFKRLIGGR
jgi:hypothetical protein